MVLLCQVNDGELSDVEPVFDRLAETLSVDDLVAGFAVEEDEDFDGHFWDADRSDAPDEELRQ